VVICVLVHADAPVRSVTCTVPLANAAPMAAVPVSADEAGGDPLSAPPPPPPQATRTAHKGNVVSADAMRRDVFLDQGFMGYSSKG
jgi:hypothetical protein